MFDSPRPLSDVQIFVLRKHPFIQDVEVRRGEALTSRQLRQKLRTAPELKRIFHRLDGECSLDQASSLLNEVADRIKTKLDRRSGLIFDEDDLHLKLALSAARMLADEVQSLDYAPRVSFA